MNITYILLSFVMMVAIVSGLNLFTGEMLSNYNSTTSNASLGMNQYNNGYVSWVSEMSDSTKATIQKTPEGILGQIITGIFWVLDSIVSFLKLPEYIGVTIVSLSNQATGSNIVNLPSWIWTTITVMFGVSLMGYLLYLLIGKSGDNSGFV